MSSVVCGWAGLSSYGGDPRVIASRDEMLRVKARLSAALGLVLGQIQPAAFLHHTIAHFQLSVHVPEVAVRLEALEWACHTAAESFLTQDARVAAHLKALETVLDDQPWLRALLRGKLAHHLMAGALIGIGVGQFLNGRAAAQLARGVVNGGPLLLGVGDAHNAANNAAELGSWLIGREHGLNLGRETGIEVVGTGSHIKDSTPKNIASLAARLDEVSGAGRPRIRIDEGELSNGGRRFVVYVPGTESVALGGKSNAFDLNSAVHSFAGDGQAAIDRALKYAMTEAGIGANDRVIFVGYSQGGLAAANMIAKQHVFHVDGLVTFGAPIGHLKLPSDVPVLAIEHTNDLVPALSGQPNPMTREWATAQRDYPVPAGHPALFAHHLRAYRDTAFEVDASSEPGLVRIRGQIEAALAQAKSETVSWFDVDRI